MLLVLLLKQHVFKNTCYYFIFHLNSSTFYYHNEIPLSFHFSHSEHLDLSIIFSGSHPDSYPVSGSVLLSGFLQKLQNILISEDLEAGFSNETEHMKFAFKSYLLHSIYSFLILSTHLQIFIQFSFSA